MAVRFALGVNVKVVVGVVHVPVPATAEPVAPAQPAVNGLSVRAFSVTSGCIGSLNVSPTGEEIGMPVAAALGTTCVTVGAVLSVPAPVVNDVL